MSEPDSSMEWHPGPADYIHFHLCPADDTGTRVGTGRCRCSELAYDGSNAPQARDLTARERDVLTRICNQLLAAISGQPISVYREEAPLLVDVVDAINPRSDDRDRDTPLKE